MGPLRHAIGLRTAATGVCIALLALTFGAARADDKTYVMKLGTATINDAQHEWCKRFVAMVERDSGGRIKGEIYPASQLGPIAREIEGVQFGAIQGYIGPPEFLVGVDTRYEVLSAPGLITDMTHGIRVASDAELQKMMFGLGVNKGIHGVALFVSQPSSIIARSAIRHLADLKGKKLRVLAADMQQEMLKRLGASPVAMTLGDVLPAIQQGAIDGAVLALTVNATMRFYDAAKYITETNQPFIFSMAFLSKKWFDALPTDLQTILDTDAGQGRSRGQSLGGQFLRQRERGLATTWRNHQSATGRTGRNDEQPRSGRSGRVEAQSRACGGVQGVRCGGKAGEIKSFGSD
jgi:TRAP-type C4-dicarboxylate transport system substrate-binding protein